jgi:hypothetical protein
VNGVNEKPGMQTVRKWLSASPTAGPEEICHLMASEIRGEINGMWAAMNGQVSARPGKREITRREARLDGMKWMLALALGIPSAAGRRRWTPSWRSSRRSGWPHERASSQDPTLRVPRKGRRN